LPFTEKSVPETVTNGDDDLTLSLGDVRLWRAKMGERREGIQKARATIMGKEYMSVLVGGEPVGPWGATVSPFSK
jgi:hypothetical protein